MKISRKEVLPYLTYVLLAVFTVLLLITFFRDQDPILLILGLFFVGTGISAVDANITFGRAIDDYKKASEAFISDLDKAIEKEERKAKRKKK